jgi:hypothetical protein
MCGACGSADLIPLQLVDGQWIDPLEHQRNRDATGIVVVDAVVFAVCMSLPIAVVVIAGLQSPGALSLRFIPRLFAALLPLLSLGVFALYERGVRRRGSLLAKLIEVRLTWGYLDDGHRVFVVVGAVVWAAGLAALFLA